MADYLADIVWFFEPFAPPPAFGGESISIVVFDFETGGLGDVLDNPSFELAAVESGVSFTRIPATWQLLGNAGALASASFGPPLEFAESYEALWPANEGALEEFDDGVDLSAAVFGTVPATVFENYETQWLGGNEDTLDNFDDPGTISAAAFDASGELVEDYEEEAASRHAVADYSRYITDTFIDSTPVVVETRLNEIKAKFNAHIADGTVHAAADATNTITSPDATNLATALTLGGELWADCWAHILDGGLAWHNPDLLGSVLKPGDAAFVPPATYANLADIANLLTVGLDLHFTWADNSGPQLISEFKDLGSESNIFELLSSGLEEDYESGWNGNEGAISAFVGVGTDLDDADFASDSPPLKVETYEEPIDMPVALAAATAGAAIPVDRSSEIRVEFTGTLTGSIKVQGRRGGSATWFDASDLITGPFPATEQTGNDYDEVRIYTETYSAGAPVATAFWPLASTI